MKELPDGRRRRCRARVQRTVSTLDVRLVVAHDAWGNPGQAGKDEGAVPRKTNHARATASSLKTTMTRSLPAGLTYGLFVPRAEAEAFAV